ncbi:DegT/DnrJ/EryC1/StrS family aminotransferase [soil metagenome]
MTLQRPVVPLLVPDLPDRHALWPYLQRMDEARQYSNFGPLVRDLESQLAAMFTARSGGARPVHVTTVGSATLGLELALASMNLKPGARVLLPAFTFVATATAVIRAGLVPVIADIDRDSWALTPEIADAAFVAKPFDAVLPVAAFGQPHDVGPWQAFSQRRGVPVLIDAAGAFGSQWLGSFDKASSPSTTQPNITLVFSLHTTKSLPAGEGGLVVSSNAAQIRQVRQRSNFGINLDPARDVPVGVTDMLGTNAKLSEYHAAVALASLARWQDRAAVRRGVMARCRAALSDASNGQIVWQAGEEVAAPTLLCLRWPGAGKGSGAADRLERECAARGVMTRRWYQPLLHRHPLAAGCAEHLGTPVADELASELIGLPFFPDMSAEQIALVAKCVARVARDIGGQHGSSKDSATLPSRSKIRTSTQSTASTIEPSPHGHS